MIIHSMSSRIRFILTITLIFTIMTNLLPVTAFAFPIQASPQTTETPSKLERQVTEWTSQLAKQEPFSSWQTADPQIEALGPGTHSWLVLFTKEGRNIGYMVVDAIVDGSFQLGEYGVGPYTLFSEQLLTQSLIDNGLMDSHSHKDITTNKHYIHPFAAVWEVTIGEDSYWLDAKTAELLPINQQIWFQLIVDQDQDMSLSEKNDAHKLSPLTRIAELKLNDTFDAYERLPWLTKEAPFSTKKISSLQSHLSNKKHLRYVIEPFGAEMLYAVPIVGYQRWTNGRIDLAVDIEGLRFIPLKELVSKGLFYR